MCTEEGINVAGTWMHTIAVLFMDPYIIKYLMVIKKVPQEGTVDCIFI